MQTLEEIIEKPSYRTLWGEKYWGNDVLCDIVLGDGKKLLCVTMLNNRPFSHFIRVDSSFNVECDDWESEVFEALTEEFGDCNDDNEIESEFPCVDFDGYTYAIIRWRDILPSEYYTKEEKNKEKRCLAKVLRKLNKVKNRPKENDENYASKMWEIIDSADCCTETISIKKLLDYEKSREERVL